MWSPSRSCRRAGLTFPVVAFCFFEQIGAPLFTGLHRLQCCSGRRPRSHLDCCSWMSRPRPTLIRIAAGAPRAYFVHCYFGLFVVGALPAVTSSSSPGHQGPVSGAPDAPRGHAQLRGRPSSDAAGAVSALAAPSPVGRSAAVVVGCHTVNPVTFFAHPVTDDEEVHDCAKYVPEEESKVTQQQKCTTAARQISPNPVGQQVYIRNFVRRWKDSKFEGPYPVTQSTLTAVKVEGRKPWIQLSDIRLAPALCQTSPLVQEHLEESEQKEE
ncbi:hypothetical protein NDU88_005726 [Pleurodeles waltl]|uniref:Uncharacterized protein n=1 Tax=Pleurodeles waltl TaxID=8319 RepID=A0AAV7SMG7_PLEWA|nr:hypothetical protein NDU88_005726 [Pleurodeles waltl]